MAQKLKGAAYRHRDREGLYNDAWSLHASRRSAPAGRAATCSLSPSGGNFFDFHPLRLLSGSYLSPDDVMDDRVLLDKETAWLLFGAFDVAGMSFSLDGTPVVVAGVYEHEKDAFSKLAYGEDMRIYMSYSVAASRRLDRLQCRADAPERYALPNCFEFLRWLSRSRALPKQSPTREVPLKVFRMRQGPANTYRLPPGDPVRAEQKTPTRSMQRSVSYVSNRPIGPYPTGKTPPAPPEDRAALWLLLGVVTGVFPIALLFYELIRYAVKGKKKLEDEILPNTGKKSRELVRAWSRRRWERKHPDEVQADEYQ